MVQPAALRKQVAEAERVRKEVYETQQDDAAEAAQLEASPEGDEEAGEAESSSEETPTVTASGEDYEAKFKTLKGKYDSEIGSLTQQNRQLQEALERAQQPAPEPEIPNERLISDAEREEFGDELIAVAKKAAREELRADLAKLSAQGQHVQAGFGNLSQTLSETARIDMLRDLDRLCPNWRKINDDSKFVASLNVVDVFSGQNRLDQLRQAFGANDTSRVLAFFKGYEEQTGQTSTAQADTPSRGGLETLVAPGKTAGTRAASGARTSGKIWTTGEIAQVADKRRRGQISDEDWSKIEKDIFQAQSENRIR